MCWIDGTSSPLLMDGDVTLKVAVAIDVVLIVTSLDICSVQLMCVCVQAYVYRIKMRCLIRRHSMLIQHFPSARTMRIIELSHICTCCDCVIYAVLPHR